MLHLERELSSAEHVLHSCDNPPCCNPAHLRVGTHAENMADMAQRGRASRSPRVKGDTHPRSLLTSAQVAEARASYSGRYGECTALARRLGVSKSVMHNALRRKTWR